MFESAGIAKSLVRDDALQVVRLDAESLQYRKLTDALHYRGINASDDQWPEYSRSELEAFDFVWMKGGQHWGYPQPEKDYRARTYDLTTACVNCGNGARQVAPFSLKAPPRARTHLLCLNWEYEYLISVELVHKISTARLSGCEFWPLLRACDRAEIDEWRQLYVAHQIGSMSEMTQFPVVSDGADRNPSLCYCGKRGRNFPAQIVYNREAMRDMKDFNHSAEWLGAGFRTYQALIISVSAYRLLAETSAIFEPVTFV